MPNGILSNVKSIVSGFFNSKLTEQESFKQSNPIYGNIEDSLFKEQIISFVKNEFEKRQEEKLPLELRWRLVQNFIQGNQYCDINEVSSSIYQQEKQYWWESREVYNHMAAIVETRLAKLGRLRPSMTVRPMTSDGDDITSAKVCRSIVDSTYASQKMVDKISEANSWAEICGSVFYKNTWNAQNGQLMGYIKTCKCEEECNCPPEAIYEGDVETTVIPAYEIFPDSILNDGPNRCRSIIHAKAFSVDEIKEIWNVEVPGSDVDVFGLGTTRVGIGGLGYTATVPISTQTIKHDSAIVMEYYELPNRIYPEGRLIICTNDELLYYGTCPYKVGENNKISLPFVRQSCVREAGSFFSISVAERCLPIQRAYNAVKNRKHEYLNRLAIGVLTYEENSIDDVETLEEDGLAPGTILPRRQGSAPPSFIDSASVPPALLDEEQKLMQEFREISGVSELSSASQAPTGTGSGVALEVLKEQDDTRISLTAENVRQAILEVAKHWLRLYKQYATGPRMARLVGKNNAVYVNLWTANQITSDDVVPLTEDDLAQTPAQKKQQVAEILKLGLFNDPDTGRMDRATRAKVLEMFNYGNWEDGDDIDQLHINKAMRENIDIQNSYELRVREFDNHTIHIEEHNKFRLSSDYDDLAKERPDLADYFDNHVKVHQQAIQMMEQQQMMQQQAMKPLESMRFSDLPPAGQIQMAQQAGISLNQSDVANNPNAQAQMNNSDGPKMTNTNFKGPRNPINNQRG